VSLADLQTLVDDLVRDTDQDIGADSRDAAIAGALARYSVDAPRRIVADAVVGAEGVVPLPAEWVPGLSALSMVEDRPGQRTRTVLTAAVRETPAGEELLVDGVTIGEAVRLYFTGAHALQPVATVPVAHQRALACLAASDLCGQLAAHYSNEGAPTIGADTVDHQGKSGRWRSRARDLAGEYTRIVGAAPTDRARPASADAVLPSRNSLGGGRLFHPPSNWPR
jgi:hypothetical protein